MTRSLDGYEISDERERLDVDAMGLPAHRSPGISRGLYERFGFEPLGDPRRWMRVWRGPDWFQGMAAEKLSE